ncbi:fungal hydrophobin-domain-containing protein [Microdochium trichocladiopsis]|uniref:Fungal hydrophobin-domain-containing protein n=1 Tax=Microdochium trichocladiopsis TaxID=1682393 RepID=A0A9P8YD78_9PEZI|nr:fungal hydrophobin-domain-containing protein [Microdochium trichocladiopsis]KAH7039662.1 fungal hydrophobin-domain-containing protein [Microdochium trichocladiopsis]
MKTTFAIASLFAAASSVLAAPTMESRQVPYDPCSGLYDTPLCCATDVLGVADLDCANPPAVVTDPANFQSTCATAGQRARCCILPLLGQGILCQTPAGVVY